MQTVEKEGVPILVICDNALESKKWRERKNESWKERKRGSEG